MVSGSRAEPGVRVSTEQPQLKRLLTIGAAIAIPLAAVALYFAFFDQPAPPSAGPVAGAAQPALPADHPPVGGPAGGAPGERHPQMGEGGRAVRVPEDVKGKWRAVKLKVEWRDGKQTPQVLTVALGAAQDIPGSKLRVQAREFLPALQVQNAEITSAGNEPANPAALVSVQEDGREIFKGWLFAKFPEMQPFDHPAYRITLVEGVPAK
jgi:hypothetical protein